MIRVAGASIGHDQMLACLAALRWRRLARAAAA
jgi:hypothetical protein